MAPLFLHRTQIARAICGLAIVLMMQHAAGAAEGIAGRLADLALDRGGLLLGERHRRPESVRLFLEVVQGLSARGTCPVIGLEISETEQPALNRLAAGDTTADAIRVPGVIDHPAYRELLAALAEIPRTGCARLLAIDGGPASNAPRPAVMFRHVAPYAGVRPVVVLVGNIHTLKRIGWLPSVPPRVRAPELGEQLAEAGIPWVSVLQHWPGGCAGPRLGRLAPIESEAGRAAVGTTFEPMAADAPHDPHAAADLVVSWACR